MVADYFLSIQLFAPALETTVRANKDTVYSNKTVWINILFLLKGQLVAKGIRATSQEADEDVT